MVQFRKNNPTLVYGDYESLQNDHPQVYAYRRWDNEAAFLILLNFSDQPQHFERQFGALELLVNNYDYKDSSLRLRPWEAKVFKILS
jgi:oligo-1,6-glucosidase